MSKRISKLGLYDFFAETEEAPIYPLDVNDLNPESKNREMNSNNTLDFLAEKWYGKYHEFIAIVNSDGYTVAANKGDATSCGLTGEQIEKHISGSTVLHTHTPDNIKANGGTFTWANVKQMGIGEAQQIACSPEGNYTMRFGPHSDIRGFQEKIWQDKEKIERRLAAEHEDCLRKYKNGEYISGFTACRDNNNRQLAVIHEYYKAHAAQYGIDYSFTPNEAAMNNEHRKHYLADKKLKVEASRKPRRTGKGSKTEPVAKFRDRETGKVYMQYKVNGEYRMTDGSRKYMGSEAQNVCNRCTRVCNVSRKQYTDWMGKQKRKAKK